MTTDRLARLFDWFRIYGALSYDASGNDADRDGLPDRADVDDGNGVDCSGAVWAAYAYAWEPDRAPFMLSSTSGYALMAEHNGWWVPLSDVRRGDILLHSTNGDVFHSDGPVGHTELFDAKLSDGRWDCAGSSGSGKGVGIVPRHPSFWQAALRIPGLEDHSQPGMTPEQWAELARALEELDVEHGQAVDTVCAAGGRIITLARGGELYGQRPGGAAITLQGTGWWPNQDVARKIVLKPECLTNETAPIRGWVQDLNGALHGFAEAGAKIPAGRSAVYFSGGKILAFNEA